MSKRKGKRRKSEKAHEPRKVTASEIVNLITALVNLAAALILLRIYPGS